MDWSWLAIGIIVGFFSVQWMRTNRLLADLLTAQRSMAHLGDRVTRTTEERWEADQELKPYVQEQLEAVTAAAVQRKQMHEAAKHKDWVLKHEAQIRANRMAYEQGIEIDWEAITPPGMSSGPSGESGI